ncbi:hypothetical protein [Gimesia chilikensis]|uniref:Lipocalin-like domain-containing protein n=1 Tax=Gimesia chilikensis TaxID=2605989 RepID=A0A517PLI2_9PLAN|nr:hypothetical protein [Gimesia chilikensis]QDT20222.1 hypothetical protein HG66A1_20070 [Gimesia chilikensis]
MFNQECVPIFLTLTLFLPTFSCSKELNPQKKTSSIVGTWQFPGPNKPALHTDWGPLWTTYIINSSGKFEYILSDKGGDVQGLPEGSMFRQFGTYKITDTTFETEIDGEVVITPYSLQNDHLILTDKDGKTVEFIRLK